MTVHWLEQVVSDVPDNTCWLCKSEISRLSGMRFPKRRSDWRLGRWTAKNAVVASLNLPRSPQTLASVEIRAAESGAPEAFLAGETAAVSISLSHRAGVAACVVAPLGTMLGCDLEVAEPRSQAFLDDYFTEDEQALVAGATAADRDKVVNLLWSAKESALKALNTGLRLNLGAVSVTQVEALFSERDLSNPINISTIANLTAPDMWHALRISYANRQVFQAWWQQKGVLLRTMVSNPAPQQPVPLVTP